MIEMAAVRINSTGAVLKLPVPARHGDILNMMKREGILPADYSTSTLCGFIDTERGFVDRHEAFEIAEAAGQLLPVDSRSRQYRYEAGALYSEDVWDDRGRRAVAAEADNAG